MSIFALFPKYPTIINTKYIIKYSNDMYPYIQKSISEFKKIIPDFTIDKKTYTCKIISYGNMKNELIVIYDIDKYNKEIEIGTIIHTSKKNIIIEQSINKYYINAKQIMNSVVSKLNELALYDNK